MKSDFFIRLGQFALLLFVLALTLLLASCASKPSAFDLAIQRRMLDFIEAPSQPTPTAAQRMMGVRMP